MVQIHTMLRYIEYMHFFDVWEFSGWIAIFNKRRVSVGEW